MKTQTLRYSILASAATVLLALLGVEFVLAATQAPTKRECSVVKTLCQRDHARNERLAKITGRFGIELEEPQSCAFYEEACTGAAQCGVYDSHGEQVLQCATCGDGICDAYETCVNTTINGVTQTDTCGALYCQQDCSQTEPKPICGNNICEEGEGNECPSDCGCQQDSDCGAGESCQNIVCTQRACPIDEPNCNACGGECLPKETTCGNSICDANEGTIGCDPATNGSGCENYTYCPQDCLNTQLTECQTYVLAAPPAGCTYRYFSNEKGCDVPELVCEHASLSQSSSSATDCRADFNRDGKVNAIDAKAVEVNFNMTGAAHVDGDANGDGTVSGGDYSLVLNDIGQMGCERNTVGSQASSCQADFNGDGKVNAIDAKAVEVNLGMTGAAHVDGDANGDGTVSGGDYSITIGENGRTDCQTVSQVPAVSIDEAALVSE